MSVYGHISAKIYKKFIDKSIKKIFSKVACKLLDIIFGIINNMQEI
jgi:hypothetical protein